MRTGISLGMQSFKKQRFLSLVTLFTFAVTNFITPGTNAFAAASLTTPTLESQIQLPYEIGTIRQVFHSPKKNAPTVIHIQSAHALYDAQKNIANILQLLQEQYGVDHIFVEGSNGEINTSFFRAFPIKEVRNWKIDQFVREGRVTGAESYSMTSEQPAILHGVDNVKFYLENIETYLQAVEVQNAALPYLQEVDENLRILRPILWNEKLQTFFENYERFHEGKGDSVEYIRSLIQEASDLGISLKKYRIFLKIREIEKYQDAVNVNAMAREVSQLLERDLLDAELTEEETKQLAMMEMDFKAKRVDEKAFYSFLKELSFKQHIDFKNYPNLNRYLEYIIFIDVMDADKFHKEQKGLEKAIVHQLILTKEEKELYRFTKNLSLLLSLPQSRRKGASPHRIS